jgi:uncharacterized membrane protein YhhN
MNQVNKSIIVYVISLVSQIFFSYLMCNQKNEQSLIILKIIYTFISIISLFWFPLSVARLRQCPHQCCLNKE